ncbi:MAG: YbaB/EbfC family nucleoid-associated protein [Pirellulales bacterium]
MFKGLANLASLVKQAQQVGAKLQGLNEQLKAKRVTGTAGGGMVQAEANGVGELISVRIDAALFAQNDRELIEDLIPAAVNQALERSRQLHAEGLKSMTEGVELPGLAEALNNMAAEGGDEKPK